jgi:hypothetical protein
VVQNYIKTNSNFKGTSEWFNGFMQRWKSTLPMRITENYSISRIRACNQNVVYNYFELLRQTLENKNIMNKPSNIWNCDESGYQCQSGSSKIVCKKGDKNIIKATNNGEKNYYTVMTFCNADGVSLPPLILFEGAHLWSTWTKDGPNDAL